MKSKAISKLTIAVLTVFIAMSCSNSKKNTSSVTGWKYNDKKTTGFVVEGEVRGKIPPGMVAVEGGTFTMGEKAEYITAPRDNQRRRITVRSFYMDQYEIRNVDWREYVHWTELVFKRASPELVDKARPDETVWREELAYNEPYIAYYFSHPSFSNYPVVGVSWEQAMDYCIWRTDRINELALINAGIIEAPDFISLENEEDLQTINETFVFNTDKYLLQASYQPIEGRKGKTDLYGQPRKVTMADGILFPDVRLPTEAEWEFAAYGLKANPKDAQGFIDEGRIYPWSSHQVRSPKKKYRGQMMANFVRGRGDMMGTSGALNDKGVITLPVESFFPNEFGLYNMAGNVNEWVLDVYRSTTFDDMAEYNSFRGNVYTEPEAIDVDENGNKVYELDSLGRVRKVVLEDGDKRDYKDGDANSRLLTDFFINGDTTGLSALQTRNFRIDPTDVLSPAIDNNTRVYKGGSWKDRVYWLSPSSRRYLDQKEKTNDIGFRCAMSMIGEAENKVKPMK